MGNGKSQGVNLFICTQTLRLAHAIKGNFFEWNSIFLNVPHHQNGQIKLSEPVRLPENSKVYVVVPGVEQVPRLHVMSPRLARPERSVDFVKEVTEGPRDAAL